MSVLMMIPMMITMEMKTSSSPMTILMLILLISWTMAINLLLMGTETWPMIYLIMLFNGGLMIIYLFVISMLPKEKKQFSRMTMTKTIMIMLISMTSYSKTKMMFNEMFKLSTWIILSTIIMVSMMSMLVFILMMDPFKTMKSSF